MGLVENGRRPCRIVVERLLIDQTFLLQRIRHFQPPRGLVTPPLSAETDRFCPKAAAQSNVRFWPIAVMGKKGGRRGED